MHAAIALTQDPVLVDLIVKVLIWVCCFLITIGQVIIGFSIKRLFDQMDKNSTAIAAVKSEASKETEIARSGLHAELSDVKIKLAQEHPTKHEVADCVRAIEQRMSEGFSDIKSTINRLFERLEHKQDKT